jgi:hypothetical protein
MTSAATYTLWDVGTVEFRIIVSKREDTVQLPCIVQMQFEGGMEVRSESTITMRRREVEELAERMGVTGPQLLPLRSEMTPRAAECGCCPRARSRPKSSSGRASSRSLVTPLAVAPARSQA